MGDFVRKLVGADDGNVAIEYGLLAALVAVTVLIAVSALGGSVNGQLSRLAFGSAGAQAGTANAGGAPNSSAGAGGAGNNGKANGAGNGNGGGNGKGNNGNGNGNGGSGA